MNRADEAMLNRNDLKIGDRVCIDMDLLKESVVTVASIKKHCGNQTTYRVRGIAPDGCLLMDTDCTSCEDRCTVHFYPWHFKKAEIPEPAEEMRPDPFFVKP